MCSYPVDIDQTEVTRKAYAVWLAQKEARLQAVLVQADPQTGHALHIEKIDTPIDK